MGIGSVSLSCDFPAASYRGAWFVNVEPVGPELGRVFAEFDGVAVRFPFGDKDAWVVAPALDGGVVDSGAAFDFADGEAFELVEDWGYGVADVFGCGHRSNPINCSPIQVATGEATPLPHCWYRWLST